MRVRGGGDRDGGEGQTGSRRRRAGRGEGGGAEPARGQREPITVGRAAAGGAAGRGGEAERAQHQPAGAPPARCRRREVSP